MSVNSYDTKLEGYDNNLKIGWRKFILESNLKKNVVIHWLSLQRLGVESDTKLIMAILRFNEKIPSSRNLGQQIARFGDAETTQSYLNFLTHLLNNNKVPPSEVLALLASKTNRGWTLGSYIARHQDAETTQSYLALVKNLLNNDKITPSEVLALLISKTNNGWTLAYIIDRYQGAAATQSYLALVTSLLNNDEIDPSNVLALLASKDNNNWTLGDIIACCQDEDSSNAGLYSKILEWLYLHPKALPATRRAIEGLPNLKIEPIYKLVKNNLARPDDIKAIAKEQKKALLDYIDKLPLVERYPILEAIHEEDSTNSFSRLFQTTRRLRKVNKSRGVRKLSEEAFMRACGEQSGVLITDEREELDTKPDQDDDGTPFAISRTKAVHLEAQQVDVTSNATPPAVELSFEQRLAAVHFNDIPEVFKCPINQSIMTEPVMLEDGYSYEESVVLKLISDQQGKFFRSPKTNALIRFSYTPNSNLKNTIQAFVENAEQSAAASSSMVGASAPDSLSVEDELDGALSLEEESKSRQPWSSFFDRRELIPERLNQHLSEQHPSPE